MSLFVNGLAIMYAGTGPSDALEAVGYGDPNGIQVGFEEHSEGVHTDKWGPAIPEDEQMFGKDANVSMVLTNWDEAVLARVRSRNSFAAPNTGPSDINLPLAQSDLAPMGSFWGGDFTYGSPTMRYFRLLIPSPISGLPLNFFAARIRGQYATRAGTRVSRWNLSLYCRPVEVLQGASLVKVLFNRYTGA